MRTREELLTMIKNDAALAALYEHVLAGVDGVDADASHDAGHVLRVAQWTVRIAQAEMVALSAESTGPVDKREAVAAALLHDLVNVRKDSPDRHRASEYSADAAAPLLCARGFDDAAVERICGAIRDHSYSRGATPSTALGRALQDADRLEALGSIGVMRTAATRQRMQSAFFHESDPWARERDLDDRAYSIDHFFAKLLRLPETMTTEAGRNEARRRAAFMEAFLDQLADELGIAR